MSSNNPTFVVYTGCMFSSKTTKLLSAIERHKLQNKTVAVFKPSLDDRYDTSDIVSHAGWKHSARTVKEGADILGILSEEENQPDVVAIDEAFMIPGVAEVLIWLYRTGISVIVSSLDLSYTGKPFKENTQLLPWATHIEKCAAICTVCGRDAFYTHKKQVTGEELENGIEVGGAELYEPRCWRHHLAIDNRPKIHDK